MIVERSCGAVLRMRRAGSGMQLSKGAHIRILDYAADTGESRG